MTDEVQNTAPTTTTSTNEAPINQNPTTEAVDTTPETKDSQVDSEDNYDWVPKKYMRDGKPDFQAMEKARANLEKKLSQKGISLAPETPDEYTFEPTDPGLEYDPETSAAFKNEALKMGLTVDQYQFIMQKYEQEVGQYMYTAERAAAELKTAWGDDFAQNLQYANRAFEEYVPSDVSINEIGNNPAVLKILARIGAELGEDSAPARSTSRGVSHTQEDIERLMASPEYGMAGSEARQTVDAWFKKKYG